LLPAVDLGEGLTAVAISLGGFHTCAILNDSTLKCWGWNAVGQLGLGSLTSAIGATANSMGDNLDAVDLGDGRFAISVALGSQHTCALLDDGSVKCWGSGNDGRLGLEEDV